MSDLYLIHHGIRGQKWGERNGPPYPLDEHRGPLTRKQRHYRRKELQNVSDDELQYIVNRLRLERQYNDYIGRYTGSKASERIINKSLDKSVDTAFKMTTDYVWDGREGSFRRH